MISYVECWGCRMLRLQHLDFLIPRCACCEARYDSHLYYIIRYRVLMFLFWVVVLSLEGLAVYLSLCFFVKSLGGERGTSERLKQN